MSKITDEDRGCLEYFHEEKGDITRWCDWEDMKPVFQEEHPELITAMESVRIANLTLNSIVKVVCGLSE